MASIPARLALAAVATLGAACAIAQSVTPQADPVDARRVMAQTNLCEWFRDDDRITWEAAAEAQVAQWAIAVRSIANAYGMSDQEASRKLVAMCHDVQARK
jgi:lipase chaperone LimK